MKAPGSSLLITTHKTALPEVYNMMVPAKPRDTIEAFLAQLQGLFAVRNPAATPIKCQTLFVEDHYEVDPRYSVEECLGDMMRVVVTAARAASQTKKQVTIVNTNQQPPKNDHKRSQPEPVSDA